ncbi:MAG TPA: polyprenyl synthetase family protein [Candidatus Limnocylindrales bacterium]|nr:polyprenyl synthetase family protein [Candidatus Limnocylindrales bacterium]
MRQQVDLFGPAGPELRKVEGLLRNLVANDPPEVGKPMAELLEAGGKRIRPGLVLLSAMCGTYDRDRTLPAAMAVEVTHAATLVHDDVIDRAPTRRGRPTVAASLGDEPAIVVGDFYFAEAYELAARTNTPEVVAILADAVMKICAGEVRQQAIRYRYSTRVEEYMQRIEAKTATLLAACCDIGALLGGLDERRRAALRAYGRSIGLAFQIADDVLDYTGSEGEVGKPIGHDILEGFATLPLMLASLPLDDGRKLSDDEARRVVEDVRRSDGPRKALEEARRHADDARDHLDAMTPGDATSALIAMADYVVTRKL